MKTFQLFWEIRPVCMFLLSFLQITEWWALKKIEDLCHGGHQSHHLVCLFLFLLYNLSYPEVSIGHPLGKWSTCCFFLRITVFYTLALYNLIITEGYQSVHLSQLCPNSIIAITPATRVREPESDEMGMRSAIYDSKIYGLAKMTCFECTLIPQLWWLRWRRSSAS